MTRRHSKLLHMGFKLVTSSLSLTIIFQHPPVKTVLQIKKQRPRTDDNQQHQRRESRQNMGTISCTGVLGILQHEDEIDILIKEALFITEIQAKEQSLRNEKEAEREHRILFEEWTKEHN